LPTCCELETNTTNRPSIKVEDHEQGLAKNAVARLPRSSGRPLRKNFLFAAVGHAFYTLCQWGIIAALTKLGEPSVVGYFAFCLALTTPIVEFTGCQLHVVQATDTRGKFALLDYLLLRISTGVIAGLIVACMLGLSALPLWVKLAALTMTCAKLVEGCSLICHGHFQRDERMEWVARSQIFRGTFALGSVAIIYYLTNSLLAAILILALLWTAVFVLHDLPLAWSGERIAYASSYTFEPRRVVHLARQSFPLGIGVGLNALSANLPRYFVGTFLGTYWLGIFAALAYVGIAARLLYLPLIFAVMPRLARLYQAGDRPNFLNLLGKASILGLLISAATLIFLKEFGRPLLSLMYTAEYSEYHDVFLILSASVTLHFLAAVLIAALQSAHKFVWVLMCYATTNFVLLLSLPLSIHWGGLRGAALAALLASTAEFSAGVSFVILLARSANWGCRSTGSSAERCCELTPQHDKRSNLGLLPSA